MLRVSAEAGRKLRYCVFGLATFAATLAISMDSADARRYRRQRSSYSPPFASIIVDANSGNVLQATNADGPRHPASLTKIMTLYLLFERLESGRMKLDGEMKVSEHASDQAPTKLGLRPGSTLQVEDAIKGLVTRSANDAAVVIAEAISGDEDEFARLMTRKARALGMSKTVYRNASGLPDEDQVTTARDQALLGRAIQDRFPKYYRYFSTAAFHYRGRVIRNHNKLLGSFEGVDGIKTGYTRSSGFNLVSSVRRGNRHIVGVVLGGRSGGARDATMRQLLAQHIGEGAARRTAPLVAERDGGEMKVASAETREAPRPAAAPAQTAPPIPAARPAELSSGVIAAQPAIMPGSAEPMVPLRVKTVHVKSGHGRAATEQAQAAAPTATASVSPAAQPTLASRVEPAVLRDEPARANPPLQPNHGIGTGILGTLPVSQNNAMAMAAEPWQSPAPSQPAAFPAPIPASSAPAAATPAAAAAKPVVRSGWIVQVGAFPDESEARHRLDTVRGQAKNLLGKADPFTESVAKGDKTLYRARFAGLDRDQAEAVCRTLKRSDISCITIKN
ncbi:MAG: peptidase M15 [Xanthobacteraceae bacterium]|nr:MAG: peptidase M15 [Xanthobacteraceae bacterium]